MFRTRTWWYELPSWLVNMPSDTVRASLEHLPSADDTLNPRALSIRAKRLLRSPLPFTLLYIRILKQRLSKYNTLPSA